MGGENPVENSPARMLGWLIPAWAGKTLPLPSWRVQLGAHPRVGGENRALIDRRRERGGSSPRGRGKRQIFPFVGPTHRLIPAWAGKTVRLSPIQAQQPAHPRVGGENIQGFINGISSMGSSPRGRGKRRRSRRVRGLRGLIPAWAGKTATPPQPRRARPAHPRVGGENVTHGAVP